MLQKLFCLACLVGMGFFHLSAQDHVRLMESNANFYDVQTAFQAYWGDAPYEKGFGYKQYKRWEHFMEPRCYPSGEMPDPSIAWRESMRFQERFGRGKRQGNANWAQPMVQDTLSFTAFGAIPGHGRVSCVEVSPFDPNVIYVGTPSGGMWKSTNGGQSWIPKTDQLPVIGVADIVVHPKDPQVLYLATGDNSFTNTYSIGVLRSTDGGTTYMTTGLNYQVNQLRNIRKLAIHPQNTDTLWAGTNVGLFRSDDEGASWTSLMTGSIRDIEFKADDPSVMFVTTNGGFFKSVDGGSSFSPSGLAANPAISRMEIAVSPANPNIVYVIAADAATSGLYAFYKSSDAGDSFTASANSTNILGYWPNGGAGGQAWYDLDIAMSPTDSNTVFTAGINIWKTTDGGASFTLTSNWSNPSNSSYVHGDVHKLEFVGDSLFTTCDGGIFRSDDMGLNWQDLSANLTIAQIYAFNQSPFRDDVVLAGHQDIGTSIYDGSKWTTVTWGDGFKCYFDRNDSMRMYTSAHLGQFFRSFTGIYGFSQFSPNINETSAFQSILRQDHNTPSTLYLGYQNVWRSTNATGSWTRISNFGNSFPLRHLEISVSNPDVLYAATNFYCYRSLDGGASWTNISAGLPTSSAAISNLHIDPYDHLSIWATFSGYVSQQKLYHSSDGGTTWTNASTNLPNLPANCIETESGPLNGIYVGMDVGVYYKNDTMNLWAPFNDGLPSVIVTELTVMPGIQKIRAATYGRGVWESDLFVDTLVVGIPNPPAPRDGEIFAFPNPAASKIAVDFSALPNFIPERAQVYAMDGRLVMEKSLRDLSGTQVRLAVDKLPAGAYSCVLTGAGTRHSVLFMKSTEK